MKNYLVVLYPWEDPKLCGSDEEFEANDQVIIEGEFGNELGIVEAKNLVIQDNPEKKIIRKATKRDSETFERNEEKKTELLKICKSEIKRLNLEMKVVNSRVSLDGNNVIIAFTAEGRIDFRELVKNLSKIFHRSVKMHQIGSRDEARRLGGCGVCGRELCCVRFSGNLPSISTEMARVQMIAHRGSERISGICGRLMCCLAYEAEQYKEMLKGMPEIHSFVKTKDARGQVIEINALKQDIKVRLDDGEIIIVKKSDLK
jgi:cell fate regulator YaaT (PSP1 superfamily)